MEKETVSMLLSCIKSAITGQKIEGYDSKMLPALYALAASHDMAHLVAEALDVGGLLGQGEIADKLRRARLAAVFRQAQFDDALATLDRVLSAAEIAFLPLKGAVIRTLYPAAWQRTSCDIDVLVREEDLTAAAEALAADGGFEVKGKGSHDLSLYSAGGVHIELHYTLVEDHIPLAVQAVLRTVWAHSTPTAGTKHAMSDAFFYFYHIAHMEKHFMMGGCGIRPLVDLFLLQTATPPDAEARALLEEGGLATFADAAETLAAVWLGEGTHNSVTARMESFILQGGVYGTLQNHVAVAQKKQGGKLGYLLSKIFLPYRVLKYQYPILVKHKWLTPFCAVRRWVRLIFGGGRRGVIRTVRVNNGMSREEVRAVRALFEELEI